MLTRSASPRRGQTVEEAEAKARYGLKRKIMDLDNEIAKERRLIMTARADLASARAEAAERRVREIGTR